MAEPAARLPEPARRRLLEIARKSVQAAIRGHPQPPLDVSEPELQRHGGVFVTLKTAGRLRGCIGRFESSLPLWQTVAAMARAAAIEDPRFFADRISPRELPAVAIDISVLSPMEEIGDPLDIELGVHGIYVVGPGGRSGTYLPQVATEHHMSKEEFLSSCCAHKAGLPADAWRSGEATVYVYTADVIEEAG